MTSISGTLDYASAWASGSRVQSLLNSAVSTGAVPSADQVALKGAISDIFGTLLSGATSAAGAATTTNTTASTSDASTASTTGTIADRVDGLIDNEVSSGKLSSDQANELKGLFAKAMGHHHHVHATTSSNVAAADANTDPLSLLPDATTSTGTDANASVSGPTALDQASSALGNFIKEIRSIAKGNGLYGASGATQSGLGSLLVNSFA